MMLNSLIVSHSLIITQPCTKLLIVIAIVISIVTIPF